MEYLTTDLIVFYITLTANICYGLLFVYHFVKKDSNKSLMILAGSLCLAMAVIHTFTSYKIGLDKSSLMFYNSVIHVYLIWMIINAITLFAITGLHRLLALPYHDTVKYVLRCLGLSIVLNMIMHVDIILLGNRDSTLLYSLYSYGENLITAFMFCSVLVARKWSEVFKWLQLAHSR
ncbi:MAG: hypothetical protein HRT35_19970 [Algicola sp.]|nr:hypothetical protein [Algicola sp.]